MPLLGDQTEAAALPAGAKRPEQERQAQAHGHHCGRCWKPSTIDCLSCSRKAGRPVSLTLSQQGRGKAHLWADLVATIEEIARKDLAADDRVGKRAEDLALELDGEAGIGRQLDEDELRALGGRARGEERLELVERACRALTAEKTKARERESESLEPEPSQQIRDHPHLGLLLGQLAGLGERLQPTLNCPDEAVS